MTSRRVSVALATRLPLAEAGGIESAVRELAPRLAARRPGWDVRLASAYARADRWNRTPFLGDLIAALRLAAKTRGCDAVVINGAEYAWPRMLRERERARTLVVWHGTRAGEIPALVPAMSLAVRVYRLLEVWLQRFALHAARQIVVSETTAREVRQTYGRHGAPLALIPNGAPLNGKAVRREPAGRRRVAWIGTNAYKKGLDIARAACALARERLPDLEFVAIGIARPAVREPEPWATYAGRVGHAASLALLESADVLLATSRYEGCSVAIIEALSLGLPIVAGPSVAWMVGAGGVAVERFTAVAFAEALTALLVRPERLAELSREARRQVQRFDWDAAADAYVAEIDACLGTPPDSRATSAKPPRMSGASRRTGMR